MSNLYRVRWIALALLVPVVLSVATWSALADVVYNPSHDVNNDGVVDVVDVQQVAAHWGARRTWTDGDLIYNKALNLGSLGPGTSITETITTPSDRGLVITDAILITEHGFVYIEVNVGGESYLLATAMQWYYTTGIGRAYNNAAMTTGIHIPPGTTANLVVACKDPPGYSCYDVRVTVSGYYYIVP